MVFSSAGSEYFKLIMIGLVVFLAAITDFRSQRIPNKITFPAILIGCVFHAWSNGFSGLMFSLKGAGLGLGLFIIPYMIGKMGAGDAKLMGAVGAFLGPMGAIISFLYISIIGGIYALLLILFHRQRFKGFLKEQYHNLLELFLTRKVDMENTIKTSKRPRLCYGIAIAAGTWLYIGLELLCNNHLVPL